MVGISDYMYVHCHTSTFCVSHPRSSERDRCLYFGVLHVAYVASLIDSCFVG